MKEHGLSARKNIKQNSPKQQPLTPSTVHIHKSAVSSSYQTEQEKAGGELRDSQQLGFPDTLTPAQRAVSDSEHLTACG